MKHPKLDFGLFTYQSHVQWDKGSPRDQKLGSSWETDVTVGNKETLGPGDTLPQPETSLPLASGEPERLSRAVAVDGHAVCLKIRASGTERRLWIRTKREEEVRV